MSLTGRPLPAHALSRAPPKGGSQPPTSHSSSASAAWCARNGHHHACGAPLPWSLHCSLHFLCWISSDPSCG
uniref:Uncharacterized protein n=2 Tax=Oryza TaxID=4527 RepID=A0A0E0PZ28_ORYRU